MNVFFLRCTGLSNNFWFLRQMLDIICCLSFERSLMYSARSVLISCAFSEFPFISLNLVFSSWLTWLGLVILVISQSLSYTWQDVTSWWFFKLSLEGSTSSFFFSPIHSKWNVLGQISQHIRSPGLSQAIQKSKFSRSIVVFVLCSLHLSFLNSCLCNCFSFSFIVISLTLFPKLTWVKYVSTFNSLFLDRSFRCRCVWMLLIALSMLLGIYIYC